MVATTSARSLSRAGRQVARAVQAQRCAPSTSALVASPRPSCSLQQTATAATRSTIGSTSRPFSSSSIRAVEASPVEDDLDSTAPSVYLPKLARKDATLYRTLRPPPRSTYVALAHRLKLIRHSTDPQVKEDRINLLVRACTHTSYIQLVDRAREKYGEDADLSHTVGAGILRGQDRSVSEETLALLDSQYMPIDRKQDNGSLAALGNSLLGLIASEYLHLRYPNLPSRVLKATMTAYVGATSLSDVAMELGITAEGVVRWDNQLAAPMAQRQTSREAFADTVRSVVALLFHEQGLSTARQFVHTQLLSRVVPIASLLKFNDPKRSLTHLMKKLGKERPQSRMVAESGRTSINPVFVVGVWSGMEKLGEGTGSAIRMAEYRAAEDSLRRFYLSETPAQHISLPSTTLDGDLDVEGGLDLAAIETDQASFGFRDVWSIDGSSQGAVTSHLTSSSAFRASPIGTSEPVFGSKA